MQSSAITSAPAATFAARAASAASGRREILERHEPDLARGLPREVPRHVRLVHRRHRMPRHHRMPVEPADPARPRGEEVAERLVAPHRRRRDQHRRPGARDHRERDVDRPPDRADLGRGIERRAHLVVRDRRPEPRERPRTPPAGARPSRPSRAPARCSRSRSPRKPPKRASCSGRRHVEEQHRRQPGEGQHLHHRGRAGEVVAVPGDQQTLGQSRHRRCW